jgi:hypothetical protein
VARLPGAKNVREPARKVRSVVPNARPTPAAEPLTRTSVRLADTDTTRSALAAAHARTASTVAEAGANRASNAAGVSPPPRAAAAARPARSRGASAMVTGTLARWSAPVSAAPRRRTGSRPVAATAATGVSSTAAAETATVDETTERRIGTPEKIATGGPAPALGQRSGYPEIAGTTRRRW